MGFLDDLGVEEHGHDPPLVLVGDGLEAVGVKHGLELLETGVFDDAGGDLVVDEGGDVFGHVELGDAGEEVKCAGALEELVVHGEVLFEEVFEVEDFLAELGVGLHDSDGDLVGEVELLLDFSKNSLFLVLNDFFKDEEICVYLEDKSLFEFDVLVDEGFKIAGV